jgi:dTDP-4-dehydrorhamnose reductase
MTQTNSSKVLITGADGQVGLELQATAPAGWQVIPCTSQQLDVTEPDTLSEFFLRERPSVIMHLAAYTDVDAAEREVPRAEAVNVGGTANVADAACRVGARMIYVSTDFVFDGYQSHPYAPTDPANPLGVYGRTKLAGEREAIGITGGAGLVVRTAWVYSGHRRNFVRTMLHLVREQESVGVVSDQVGTPTWARVLATALWVAAERPEVQGILHWTDAGVASWYDFAIAIQEEALALGLLSRATAVRPLRTQDFPRPARRPSYSVLDKTTGWAALGGQPEHWRRNLRVMLQELARG